jgi:hypothetical protein
MNSNQLNSKKQTDCVLPENLTELLLVDKLIHASLEAAQNFYWNKTGSSLAASTVNPRVFLSLLSYSYATGVFPSRSIASRCERDQIFQYLSVGTRVTSERIGIFRGHNSEIIKRCLAFVIRKALVPCQTTPFSAWTPLIPPMVTDTQTFSFRLMGLSQREADLRFRKAVSADLLARSSSSNCGLNSEVHVVGQLEACSNSDKSVSSTQQN